MAYNTPSSDNVVFGRGRILFDRFTDAGVRTGQFIHLGNCDRLAIGVAPEELTMTDYTTESSAPYKSVTTKIELPINISGFEFAEPILRLIFMGDKTTHTQTAHTATAEAVAAATLTDLKGSFFQLGRRSITSATVLQGTATLVSGTDWELYDALAGVIRLLPASATIADGTAITANYVAAALSGSSAIPVVRGATKTAVQGKLLFIPQNTTGPKNELIVWNAKLTPDGDVGFISDEFAKWNLSGSVQSDSAGSYGGSTSDPFFRILQRA
jgi:hypothetical protein